MGQAHNISNRYFILLLCLVSFPAISSHRMKKTAKKSPRRIGKHIKKELEMLKLKGFFLRQKKSKART